MLQITITPFFMFVGFGVHHEAFLRYMEELNHHEVEVRDLTEKRDSFKLLSEKLRAELEISQKKYLQMAKHIIRVLNDSEDELDIVTNALIFQVSQRVEQIGKLQAQVDTIQA